LASDTDSFKAEDRNFLVAIKQKKSLTRPLRTPEETLKLRLPENPAALKHHFDVGLLKRYAKCLVSAGRQFDRTKFLRDGEKILSLEMKDRVHFIRDRLRKALTGDYESVLKILLRCLVLSTPGFEGFGLWPVSDFIQTYGPLDVSGREPKDQEKHLKVSLDALALLTPKFTSEFAIRPFLIAFESSALKYLLKKANSKNQHERRWASEGSRPRLPWGQHIRHFVDDPNLTSQILNSLRFDDEIYVRKSVANHLNDSTHNHARWVIQLLKSWNEEANQLKVKEREKIKWITRHALRTLIKKASPDALELIGISPGIDISLSRFKLRPQAVKIGESFEFEFDLCSKHSSEQCLVIDYVIHFARSPKVRASASQKIASQKIASETRRQKIFKFKVCSIGARSKMSLRKAHSFKKVTTRNYYPGPHRIEVQINGQVLAGLEFVVEAEE